MPIVCGQPAPVTALVPAPHDPRVMASTSQDGLLRMWRLGPEDVSGATCDDIMAAAMPSNKSPWQQQHLTKVHGSSNAI